MLRQKCRRQSKFKTSMGDLSRLFLKIESENGAGVALRQLFNSPIVFVLKYKDLSQDPRHLPKKLYMLCL